MAGNFRGSGRERAKVYAPRRVAGVSVHEGKQWRKMGGKLQEGMDGTQYWDEERRVKVEEASVRFLELLTEEWLAYGHE